MTEHFDSSQRRTEARLDGKTLRSDSGAQMAALPFREAVKYKTLFII